VDDTDQTIAYLVITYNWRACIQLLQHKQTGRIFV